MASQYSATVTIRQADGWHARPATEFAQLVGESNLEVTIGRPGQSAVRGDSVLSLLTLGARFGEELVITVTGPTAQDANPEKLLEKLTQLF